jgi:hypothetical protein
MLTEIGAESWEINNIKVIANFDTFPESINTPSYDQQFRSINPFLDRSSYLDKFGL